MEMAHERTGADDEAMSLKEKKDKKMMAIKGNDNDKANNDDNDNDAVDEKKIINYKNQKKLVANECINKILNWCQTIYRNAEFIWKMQFVGFVLKICLFFIQKFFSLKQKKMKKVAMISVLKISKKRNKKSLEPPCVQKWSLTVPSSFIVSNLYPCMCLSQSFYIFFFIE
ncbi:hypothetical protein RFI_04296 [Reticulomyxa filosa]|uniref:Uncharacterized protein n=1 Tax=Reticulomyxa filosa TaxID=46433 RepID=X6P2N1_RETFI|nr:hypothetical protein RFI_04296 [Reticulomyxa filosa]|eukprot:ETO32820.1 hypothetical protein RFI_04296 [Reticulomyxa filosa]